MKGTRRSAPAKWLKLYVSGSRDGVAVDRFRNVMKYTVYFMTYVVKRRKNRETVGGKYEDMFLLTFTREI